jgi:hypothetical protein
METKHFPPFRGRQCSQWKHIKLSQKQSTNKSSPWGMNICLGQPASLGELSFPWGNQPPLKTSQLFEHSKYFAASWGSYVSPGELCTLALFLFLRPNPFAHTPCIHYFIDIYLLVQCSHIVGKYKFVGLSLSLEIWLLLVDIVKYCFNFVSVSGSVYKVVQEPNNIQNVFQAFQI